MPGRVRIAGNNSDALSDRVMRDTCDHQTGRVPMLATREEGVKLQVLGIPKTIADVTAAARAHSGVVIFAIKMCSRLRSSTVLHGVFRRE